MPDVNGQDRESICKQDHTASNAVTSEKKNRDTKPDNPWKWTKRSVAAELLAILVMLVTLIMTCRNVQQVEDSVVLQREALESMEMFNTAQVRPFVFATALERPVELNEGIFTVEYSISNVGISPAYNLRPESRLLLDQDFPALIYEDEPSAIYPNEQSLTVPKPCPIIYANGDTAITATLDDLRSLCPIYLHIGIQYEDVVNKQYCYEVTYVTDNFDENGRPDWARFSVETTPMGEGLLMEQLPR